MKVMEIIKDILSFINSMVMKSHQAFPNGSLKQQHKK